MRLFQAVVEAYADGKIALPPPNLKAPGIKTRFASSFIEGDVDRGAVNMPYTAQTIAEFIGCPPRSIDGDAHLAQHLLGVAERLDGLLVFARLVQPLAHVAQRDDGLALRRQHPWVGRQGGVDVRDVRWALGRDHWTRKQADDRQRAVPSPR